MPLKGCLKTYKLRKPSKIIDLPLIFKQSQWVSIDFLVRTLYKESSTADKLTAGQVHPKSSCGRRFVKLAFKFGACGARIPP